MLSGGFIVFTPQACLPCLGSLGLAHKGDTTAVDEAGSSVLLDCLVRVPR